MSLITNNSRAGVSPIGTVSPNSGSAGNTNSSYAQNAYTSGINLQGTGTSYTLQDTDYQGIVLFDTSSAISVSLNSAVKTNFQTSILNIGTGAITLTTSDSSSINSGGSTLALGSGQGCQVFFANRAWSAYVGTTVLQVVPQNTPATAGGYLTGYNSSTGAFTANATAGISATITTAALTALGSQGSMTFVNGLLTAQVQAN